MSTYNGNGNNGDDSYQPPHDSPTMNIDVVAKWKDFGQFVEDVHEQSMGDIGSMVLHIHPKFIEINKDVHNRFKILIHMDKEEME